jgi:EF-P beta-lysylation protein EpmB
MHWQQLLQHNIRTSQQLIQQLGLSESDILLQPHFPVNVSLPYLKKIRKGNPHDPLLRQILPSKQELIHISEFNQDPVGDNAAQKIAGILHKYQARVLLLATGACAIHCRYCFRQHFDYQGNTLDNPDVLHYIQTDNTIQEIILSGGDPLILSDTRLARFIQQLEQIQHVKRLRIHSRLPIVLPQRITQELIDLLINNRLQIIVIVHANHPHEIDEQVGLNLQNLVKQGITVLNQSVLLKQINDDVATLAQLSEILFQYQVIPYYLHLLDKVQGAAHFDVAESEAIQLMSQLRKLLPGYLVPKLVREVAGKMCKQPIF